MKKLIQNKSILEEKLRNTSRLQLKKRNRLKKIISEYKHDIDKAWDDSIEKLLEDL